MNRVIVAFTCVVALAGAATASAQVAVGVKAGINFADLTYSAGATTVNPGGRTAWMVGGFVEIPIAPNVVLQPEGVLTTKGAVLSDSGATSAVNLTYFDVPVLVRFGVPVRGRLAPYVFAGPNIGFLLRARSVVDAPTFSQNRDIKSETASTDVGLAVGGGVHFGRLLTEVRYVQGFTNLVKDQASPGVPTVRNRVVKLIVGFRF